MDDGRDRGGGTGAYVGGRARNGRGGGNAAEERRNDVARTLADKFGIGVVLLAGHPVQYYRAQQGFYGPEHRHGEGSRQQGGKRLPAQRHRLAVTGR